jgi:predicted ribosomally synthesized peptide with SipW-like signal peptide
MSHLPIRPGNPDRAADPSPHGDEAERMEAPTSHKEPILMTVFSIPFSRAQQIKLVLFGALAIGVMATMTGRGTLAYFTTQVRSDTNTFTAGTLQLHVGDINESNLTPAVTSSISFTTMKPGDVVYAPIEIDNVGSLAAKYGILYGVTTTTGTDLTPALDLAIVGKGTGSGTKTTTATNATACNATTFGSALVWSEQTIRTAAPMDPLGQTIVPVATSTLNLAAATGVDILCMQVTFHDNGLPGSLTTGDNVYNDTTIGHTNATVNFVFDGLVSAAAVINNP